MKCLETPSCNGFNVAKGQYCQLCTNTDKKPASGLTAYLKKGGALSVPALRSIFCALSGGCLVLWRASLWGSGGGVWFGLGLGRGSHRRRVPTASVSFPHQHNWALARLSGLTAPQTVDDPRTPPRRWWEGDAAVPVCMSRALRACGGFRALGQGTVAHVCLHWAAVLLSACGGGMCVPGAPGPSSGAGEPYTKAAGESVGRVTCGLLQPTTEPQRGARGMWPVTLLD